MPPRSTRRRLGDFGEAAAAAHLLRHGYTIVARQWRCNRGEIDIVARQSHELVFVEVRTRRGAACGSPEESLTPTKQARLIDLAHTYLAQHDSDQETPWRIDVIVIEIDRSGRVSRLDHIVNAIEG